MQGFLCCGIHPVELPAGGSKYSLYLTFTLASTLPSCPTSPSPPSLLPQPDSHPSFLIGNCSILTQCLEAPRLLCLGRNFLVITLGDSGTAPCFPGDCCSTAVHFVPSPPSQDGFSAAGSPPVEDEIQKSGKRGKLQASTILPWEWELSLSWEGLLACLNSSLKGLIKDYDILELERKPSRETCLPRDLVDRKTQPNAELSSW